MSEVQGLSNTTIDYNPHLSFHLQEEEEEDPLDFNMLRLGNIHSSCRSCGRSDSSPPSSFKTTECRSSDPNIPTVKDQCSEKPNKSKKRLIPHPSQGIPGLQRSVSDPLQFASDSASGSAADPLLNVAVNGGLDTPESKRSASLPPRPPLSRTVSDPSHSKSHSKLTSSVDMGGHTPHQSPEYKRLKRMKDCMVEMSKWWDLILPENVTPEVNVTLEKDEDAMLEKDEEEEEEECGREKEEVVAVEDGSNKVIKDDSIVDSEETVSIEKVGECMNIHFKCLCGKGYQFLVSRGDCYYKLM